MRPDATGSGAAVRRQDALRRLAASPSCSALVVAGIALAMYSLALAPGLTWAHDAVDGGDLAAAIATGGVPHPPGYPTYLLAGALAARLPFGDLALRLNALSAVSAALAAGLTAFAAGRITGSVFAGAVAGLAWALAPIVWGQAVVTEVYTLNALCVAFVLACAVVQLRSPGVAFAAGVAAGVGIGTGLTTVLCAPLVALAGGRDARRWAAVVGGAAAGLLVFAALPLRARAAPPVNWGDAGSLDGFVWLVTARAYAGLAFGVPSAEWPQRFAALAGLLARQFTPVGPLLAAFGLARLWQRAQGFAVASAIAFGAYVGFATFYATTDSYVYLIPALLMAAVWVAGGVAAAAALPGRVARFGGALVAGALLLAQVVWGYPAADASHDHAARDWLAAALQDAPHGAVLLSGRDAYTFALWYGRYALGERTDVTVCDRDLWAFEWYRVGLTRETGAAIQAGSEPETAFAGRPICTLGDMGIDTCRQPGGQMTD